MDKQSPKHLDPVREPIQRKHNSICTRTNCRLPMVLAWGHAWRRPLQSIFFIIGVALGVAMIVAIDLANSAATRAFALGTEAVAGKATHQIVGGPYGLDEQVYVTLRHQLGYRLSAPVVESYVTAEELDAQPMRLLGVDSFSESPFRRDLGTAHTVFAAPHVLSAFMVEPGTILMSADVAEHYRLAAGDHIHVRIGSRRYALEIVDLLKPEDERSRHALDGLLIADIATAQEVLNKVGRLERIDLIVPEGASGTAVLERIKRILPPGARIERPSARHGAVEEMTAAFRLNLTAFSLLALVVGMFLIHNTVTFSVVQQRPVLGSLRALGMTRPEIFTMILAEAGLLGMIGTVIGLGLGILLGRGAVQLVSQTINDLFFVVAVRQLHISPVTLLKGAVGGLCAALAAAALPAYEATSVRPAGAFQRSNIEDRARAALPWVNGVGVGMTLLGIALLLPEWHLSMTFAGVFAIIIGIALLTPALTLGLLRLIDRIIGLSETSRRMEEGKKGRREGKEGWKEGKDGMEGREGWKERGIGFSRFTFHVSRFTPHASPITHHVLTRMALRDITRSLSRTSVAIAALMVAVSVIIGVSVMSGSFRLTVERWLTDLLQADIFVSPPSLAASSATAQLEGGVVEKLAAFPGIAQVATSRVVEVSAGELGTIQLVAVNMDIAGSKRHYKAAVGDHLVTWQALEAGGLIINEPIANRFKLRLGDKVTLFTDRGERRFPIVAVVYDFDVRPGALIHNRIYRQFWDDPELSSAALFVKPGVNVDVKLNELRAAFASEGELVIRSNRGLRENSLAVFDRTFSITVALQMLATVVAFIGVLSALMSLQLERSREIGTLRAIGMTRRQLWKLTLLKTGLMGASAGLIAMPTGFVLAAILLYIINLRSFGWTLQMQLQPGHFLQAFIVALVAALLAGLYPAWRMGKMQPADALRME